MKGNYYYGFWYRFVWLLMRPFHRVRAVGFERLPEGAAVLCPNHVGLADPIYAAFALTRRRRVYPMAKQELRRIPIFGKLLAWAGVIFVDRGGADIRAIKAALHVLKEGKTLLIFPQGTRVKDGHDKHGLPVTPKEGAALLATRTDTPLIPVYIQENRRLFHSVTVVFGQPYRPQIEGKRATAAELTAITQELMLRVSALKEELR